MVQRRAHWSDTTVPRQRVQPAAQPLPGRNTDLWKRSGLTSVRRVWNIATAAARDATVAIVSTTTLATSHASNSAARTTVHTSNSAMGAALLATWIAFAVDAALATEREWIGRAIWNWQSTWNGIVPHWRVCGTDRFMARVASGAKRGIHASSQGEACRALQPSLWTGGWCSGDAQHRSVGNR